ncbi:hypothetical protein E3U43_007642 [Larimichthys crocea]|uniref:Uncharacterized protein n=1 Tax=Larimichthys crocea TaxID=215358 RepID=A0ACD3Q519_LARCR|nr:hypothetical protein E3U43_007642 [Larimichthys crocea]
MKTSAVVKILVSLALILHFGRAQKPSDDSIPTSLVMLFSTSPQSLISLLLLVLTVVLSGGIYLCVLRYVCIGCCEPIVVGCEPESLAGMV